VHTSANVVDTSAKSPAVSYGMMRAQCNQISMHLLAVQLWSIFLVAESFVITLLRLCVCFLDGGRNRGKVKRNAEKSNATCMQEC